VTHSLRKLNHSCQIKQQRDDTQRKEKFQHKNDANARFGAEGTVPSGLGLGTITAWLIRLISKPESENEYPEPKRNRAVPINMRALRRLLHKPSGQAALNAPCTMYIAGRVACPAAQLSSLAEVRMAKGQPAAGPRAEWYGDTVGELSKFQEPK